MTFLRRILHGDGTYWVVPRGSRRYMLIALGVVALGVGSNLAFLEQSPSRMETFQYLALLPIPLAAWGCVWMAAGVAAIVGSFVPRTNDRWGLDVLSFVYGLWTSLFLLAGLTGQTAAWLGVAIYGACTGFVFVVANMRRVNPETPRHANQ